VRDNFPETLSYISNQLC
jgi:hypothetical protein